MSRRSVRPGPRSLVALRWLTRVGASPVEPLALVMGWNRAVVHDHVARLVRAGFVRRVPMTRGEGSLIMVTPDGARMAGELACAAPRSLAPTTWAHTVACAWAAARFEVRGVQWRSSREILQDPGWRGRVTYHDGCGRSLRVKHHPDLGVFIGADLRPAAIEVELQRKSLARLRGILAMYNDRTTDPDPQLAGVLYITDRADVAKAVRAGARAVGFRESPHGRLRLLSLDEVVTQTREIASRRRATSSNGPATAG